MIGGYLSGRMLDTDRVYPELDEGFVVRDSPNKGPSMG